MATFIQNLNNFITMPSCCFFECKNRTRSKNSLTSKDINEKISFHK